MAVGAGVIAGIAAGCAVAVGIVVSIILVRHWQRQASKPPVSTADTD